MILPSKGPASGGTGECEKQWNNELIEPTFLGLIHRKGWGKKEEMNPQLKGVVFDMDGVVIDSEITHYTATAKRWELK